MATGVHELDPPSQPEIISPPLVKRFYLRTKLHHKSCVKCFGGHGMQRCPRYALAGRSYTCHLQTVSPKTHPPPLERRSVLGGTGHTPEEGEEDDEVEVSESSPWPSEKHRAQGWAPKRSTVGEADPHRAQAQPHTVRPGHLKRRRCILPWERSPRMNFASGHASCGPAKGTKAGGARTSAGTAIAGMLGLGARSCWTCVRSSSRCVRPRATSACIARSSLRTTSMVRPAAASCAMDVRVPMWAFSM